jgi:hypothetical protein
MQPKRVVEIEFARRLANKKVAQPDVRKTGLNDAFYVSEATFFPGILRLSDHVCEWRPRSG